jgi:hypothetical protein
MPLPTKVGLGSIKAWESDYARIYSDWVFESMKVSVDGDTFTSATSGVDADGIQNWRFPVAGPDCPAPLASARTLTVGDHHVRWLGSVGSGQAQRGGEGQFYCHE